MIIVPDEMRMMRRWMVRPIGSKAPRSVLPRRPEEYVPGDDEAGPNHWRKRWNQSCIWATYAQACGYWRRHEEKIAGLCFINHHGLVGSEVATKGAIVEWRIVSIDADNAFDEDGNLWPPLQAFHDLADTYGEYSQSKRGAHWFVWAEIPALSNKVQIPVPGCPAKIDLLYSGNTAFTGDLLPGANHQVARVPADLIVATFPVKQDVAVVSVGVPDWWSEPRQPLTAEQEALVPLMESGEYDSIEGQGGDQAIFSAACELIRFGVEGWAAVDLLGHVPADPPWSEKDLKHKVAEAYKAVSREGRIAEKSLDAFAAMQASKDSGSRIYDLGTLIGQYQRGELRRDFLIEGALQEGIPTVVCGEKKCLKTSIAVDLALSLETGTPWLGQFPVRDRRQTLYFGAETDSYLFVDLSRRILAGRQLPFVEDRYQGVKTGNFVPGFHSKNPVERGRKLEWLKRCLVSHKPQVCVFDPLYLGMPEIDLANLYEVGGALETVHQTCKALGVWLILIHHAKRMNDFRPLTLNDIYGSGIGEWAGQWLLLSRQNEMIAGAHKLFLRIGGRAGDFGLWDLEVTEGEVDAICTERRWDVRLSRIDESAETDKFQTKVLDLIPHGERVKMSHFDILPYPRIQIQRALLALTEQGKVSHLNGIFQRLDVDDSEGDFCDIKTFKR